MQQATPRDTDPDRVNACRQNNTCRARAYDKTVRIHPVDRPDEAAEQNPPILDAQFDTSRAQPAVPGGFLVGGGLGRGRLISATDARAALPGHTHTHTVRLWYSQCSVSLRCSPRPTGQPDPKAELLSVTPRVE